MSGAVTRSMEQEASGALGRTAAVERLEREGPGSRGEGEWAGLRTLRTTQQKGGGEQEGSWRRQESHVKVIL